LLSDTIPLKDFEIEMFFSDKGCYFGLCLFFSFAVDMRAVECYNDIKLVNANQYKNRRITMKQFDVTGMTCAACSARVEKAVEKIPGVSSCAVSLLTNSMSVEGDASSEDIVNAVVAAGYDASEKGNADTKTVPEDNVKTNDEEKHLRYRLISSVIVLIVLMYFSMGHAMLSLPLPFFLEGNFIGQGIIQMLLSLMVILINRKFFINGIKGIKNKSPNMDTLVAMGSGVSFLYSLVMLFRMTYFVSNGNVSDIHSLMHEFYFESAAMILTLITVGKMLEAHSKGKTTNALRSLMKLAPETAVVIRNGKEVQINISEVSLGDVFVVRPGGSIPADGIVIKGMSAVDESMLTGESEPAEKNIGDKVSQGTINTSGILHCEVTGVGEETMLSNIIKMVSDAAATKAPVAKVADKVSGIFVPTVIVIALITVIVWLLLGYDIGFSLARGISVLVISCPCALGLATPVAIMVGSGIGAKNGILFKNATSLEQAGKIKIIALDKTGTVTEGKPAVTDVIPLQGITEEYLLETAYSAEYGSEHPVGKAICKRAEESGLVRKDVTEFTVHPGNGVSAYCDGKKITGGSVKFISGIVSLPDSIKKQADMLSDEGKTPLCFTEDGDYIGMIAVADTIKEDSAKAIAELKGMGLYTVMLTGDNKKTAEAVAKQAGIDKVIAGVLPDGKQSVIASLQKNGFTAMVGDGINDAPALTKADVGIAIGAGADVAIDAADIVLVKSSLYDAVKAVRLSRAVLRNIHENLFWAFSYNIIGIPLAAGAFISVLGWSMDPMFGAAAMSISSFLVVSNALRLNIRNINSLKRDKKIKTVEIQEEKTMTKTMKIEGMMCAHCEARVKKSLEAIDGVAEAAVSHEKGTAVVTLSSDVSDSVLSDAVAAQDYKVLGIE